MNEMSVKNFFNETLSMTNFPLGRIKVHLISSQKQWKRRNQQAACSGHIARRKDLEHLMITENWKEGEASGDRGN